MKKSVLTFHQNEEHRRKSTYDRPCHKVVSQISEKWTTPHKKEILFGEKIAEVASHQTEYGERHEICSRRPNISLCVICGEVDAHGEGE